MGAISIWVISLLIVLQIVSQLLVNLQWRNVALAADVQVSFREMFFINCQGAIADAITPGVKIGGEITRGVQISRRCGCSAEQATAIVAAQKMFSISSFVFLLLITGTYMAVNLQMLTGRYVQIAGTAIAALALLIIFGVFFMPKRVKKHMQIKNSLPFLMLSLIIWLIYPVKLYILAAQFSPDINIIYIAGITFISYIIGMIPIFPGGIGGFEGTMSGLLIATGFSVSDAVTAAISFRFITFWLVVIFSFGFVSLDVICKRGVWLWSKIRLSNVFRIF